MNRIFLVLILMVVYIAPIESQELVFNFECQGKNSTMSSYAYVKEPILSESGYTRGFKTGSFNYLEAGMIDLSEDIRYEYGDGTLVGNNSTNSSLTHDLTVNFDGKRGISEFYGKAFFNYNRAVSAWKKIRYEDLSRYENVTNPYSGRGVAYSRSEDTIYTLGTARTSRNFSVTASTKMESNSEIEKFNLDWVTEAKDAVIETKDAAGWSNRTGMNRIDFEHDSLMSGEELNVENHLSDSAPEPVESGRVGNWLPCCFSGSVPEIEAWSGCECANDSETCSLCENANAYWPDENVLGTLDPDKKLPNARLVRTCFVDAWGGIRCTEPKYEPISCSDLNCTDFECIYGLVISNQTGITGARDEIRSEFAKFISIQVSQILLERVPKMTYNITILNSGSVKLNNVTLHDTLPLNANYANSSFFVIGGGGGEPDLLDRNTTKQQGNNTLDRVTLSLGELESGETKVVTLRATYSGKGDPEYKTNKVYVTGDALDGLEVNKTAEPPYVPDENVDVSALLGAT